MISIVIAQSPIKTQIFAATLGLTVWLHILALNIPNILTRVELYTGPAGFEVFFMHMSCPNLAVNTGGWIITNNPITFPVGTRLSMAAFGATCTLEFHLFYR